MTTTRDLSSNGKASTRAQPDRRLFFALAAGLTIATLGFGLAIVGGAHSEDVAFAWTLPVASVR
jgi:hypothetical protein